MLNTLIESASRAQTRRSAGWGALSAAVHVTLITSAVIATASTPRLRSTSDDARSIVFVPARPITTSTSRSAATAPTRADLFRIPYPTVPDIPVPNPLGSFSPDSLLTNIGADPGGSQPGVVPSTGTPAGTLHDASTVDRAVVPLRGNPHPRYPREMQSLGIQGDVIARFVVDTTGRVEPASLEVMSVSNRSFADAVREALTHSRFAPASAGGRAVRQLVEQRFTFSLRP